MSHHKLHKAPKDVIKNIDRDHELTGPNTVVTDTISYSIRPVDNAITFLWRKLTMYVLFLMSTALKTCEHVPILHFYIYFCSWSYVLISITRPSNLWLINIFINGVSWILEFISIDWNNSILILICFRFLIPLDRKRKKKKEIPPRIIIISIYYSSRIFEKRLRWGETEGVLKTKKKILHFYTQIHTQ